MDRQASGPQLEPLRFGELIDAGFRLWRKGFKDLFIVAAIITVPVGIVGYLVERAQVIAISDTGTPIVEDLASYNAAALSLAVISLGASFLSASATLVITTRAYLAGVPDWRDAFRVAINRLFPFIGLSILMGLAIFGGFLLLIIPGIIIGLGLAFAQPAFWAEGTGPIDSMRRSWRLARGRRWPILGLLVFTGLMYGIVGFVVTGPLLVAFLTENVELYLLSNNVVSSLVTALIAPLASCLITAAYYDARVRHEAFDLYLAASRLDEAGPDESFPSFER